jgi:rSAM/selenodomain-associated transferase 2
VLNEEARLSALLRQLRDRFPSAEIVVVDGGSEDRSAAVALREASVVLLGDRGRAAQMNLGGQAARGDWLFFLHADSDPEFTEAECLASLEGLAASSAAWGFCRVRLVGRSRALPLIGWFMNRRSCLTSVATGDQGLFISRELFDRVRGFAPIPLMEDVEICKRLRRRARPACLALRVRSSGRRWDEKGVLATILRMWALRLAYCLGVSPQRLWHHYYGRHALVADSRGRAGAA